MVEFGFFNDYGKLRYSLLEKLDSKHVILLHWCILCKCPSCQCSCSLQSKKINSDVPEQKFVDKSDAYLLQPKTRAPLSNVLWANLFKDSCQHSNPLDSEQLSANPSASFDEEVLEELRTWLREPSVTFGSTLVQPRGFYNSGNFCFINAILQVLILCPPFISTFCALSRLRIFNKSRCSLATPFISTTLDLVSQLRFIPPSSASFSSTSIGSPPYEPIEVYNLLHAEKNHFVRGREEDAEEFLTYFLNKLHDEFLYCQRISSTSSHTSALDNGGNINCMDDDNDDDPYDESWKEVGPRNRSIVTRNAVEEDSPMSKMIGGVIRSVLSREGRQDSANLQPFFVLPVDIQTSSSLQQALQHISKAELVEDITASGSMHASKQLRFQSLNPILIFQLKRFVYSKGSLEKLDKPVTFDKQLEIDSRWLFVSKKGKLSASQRQYSLFAVVYHIGKKADAKTGHYTAAIYHPAYECWLYYDDTRIVKFPSDVTLDSPKLRCAQDSSNIHCPQPYLLFYRRSSSLNSHS